MFKTSFSSEGLDFRFLNSGRFFSCLGMAQLCWEGVLSTFAGRDVAAILWAYASLEAGL